MEKLREITDAASWLDPESFVINYLDLDSAGTFCSVSHSFLAALHHAPSDIPGRNVRGFSTRA